ncbi:MAG: acyltransferase family protein [Acidimicrobiales bacterium]|jgi:peptidoglycan/LPS O-acetylase OafA/YrhL
MARSDVRPSTFVPSIEPAAAIGNSEVRASGPHVSGLDGIRAFAVIGVLAFHAGVSGFGGGLLGVDIFFVLSGFLITSLLLGEWSETGTVSFRRFYEHRARRLLPGLFLLLLLVAAYAQWFAETDTLSTLRGDALSTILYVANWRFIFSGQSYFVHFGPPSPLLHTWSLAVEEQFYLVWPAVALFVMRRRGRRGLAVAAAIFMVASAVLTSVLLHDGVSVSRLYYGTDTRTQELMAGALLAVAAPAIARNARAWRWPVTVLGGLGGLFLLWALHSVSGQGNFLYEGGFLLVAVASAAVVLLVVVEPRAMMARFLGWGVLGYIGRISYGLYLYHYPIFLMIDSEHSGLSGSALLAVRLSVTLAAAVVSYHGIEMPVRRRKVLKGRRLVAALPISVAIVVTAIVLATLPAPAPAPAPPPAAVHKGLFSLPRTRPADLVDGKDVRTLLLGDSMALTLAEGLRIDADRWGVSLDDQGKIGCDLDPDSTVNIEGSITQAAQGCADWPQTWRGLIDRLNPDVVAVELGRWEVSDRIIDGKWTEIGQPAWDRVYSAELAEAIRILSSKGAHVVIFTLPYITQTTEAPNGTPWDINQPVRTNEYNALVRRVVARFPGRASVIDLNRLLDPAGKYTSYLDGVRVRNPDDEHISVLGGMLLRPLILPTLVRLGLAHESSRLHR